MRARARSAFASPVVLVVLAVLAHLEDLPGQALRDRLVKLNVVSLSSWWLPAAYLSRSRCSSTMGVFAAYRRQSALLSKALANDAFQARRRSFVDALIGEHDDPS